MNHSVNINFDKLNLPIPNSIKQLDIEKQKEIYEYLENHNIYIYFCV